MCTRCTHDCSSVLLYPHNWNVHSTHPLPPPGVPGANLPAQGSSGSSWPSWHGPLWDSVLKMKWHCKSVVRDASCFARLRILELKRHFPLTKPNVAV